MVYEEVCAIVENKDSTNERPDVEESDVQIGHSRRKLTQDNEFLAIVSDMGNWGNMISLLKQFRDIIHASLRIGVKR